MKIETNTENLYYTIECGKYASKTNANMLKNRLLENGFTSNITFDNKFYKVQIGVYRKQSDASDLLSKIILKGFDAKLVYFKF